ncbi:rhamnan synthesis F family protein [Croceicoccus sp. Ery15]|uniref:rhamnan synthesis F family protein n=1 Tax=Croceicoccus sp. Ery15 TaxID=1703338 RepID=UPI001E33FC7E|nr:rhamnan synthesis F family protein [Croceicoccus sp. Ery15]
MREDYINWQLYARGGICSAFASPIAVLIRRIRSSKPFIAMDRWLARRDRARYEWLTPKPSTDAEKLCLFVTYAPNGRIPFRAIRHAETWRSSGYSIVFIIALDNYSEHPDVPFGHAIKRENIGHDLAAWARAIKEIDLSKTQRLATVNDSTFVSDRLAASIINAENVDADLIGFSDSLEWRWHLQSYALLFNGAAINSPVFSRLWQPRIVSRAKVILTLEIDLANSLRSIGLRTACLFPSISGRNPTATEWPQQAAHGFPFVKRRMLLENVDAWRETLVRERFDLSEIESDISGARSTT